MFWNSCPSSIVSGLTSLGQTLPPHLWKNRLPALTLYQPLSLVTEGWPLWTYKLRPFEAGGAGYLTIHGGRLPSNRAGGVLWSTELLGDG